MVNLHDTTICIDTNVFIYYFQDHEVFGPSARSIFELLQDGKVVGATSVLTLAEILSYDLSPKQVKSLQHDILEIPNLKVYDIDQEISFEAAKLRRMYRIRIPDAIQLATGICNNADFFVTNNNQLKRIQEINIYLLSNLYK